MLERQKEELLKAIAENDSLITAFLDSMSGEEMAISRELEGLLLRIKDLQTNLDQGEFISVWLRTKNLHLFQLRISRVSEDHPLRMRRRVLCEKLEIVKSQVTAIKKMMEPESHPKKSEPGNKYLEYKT